jgi:hypothetical protein
MSAVITALNFCFGGLSIRVIEPISSTEKYNEASFYLCGTGLQRFMRLNVSQAQYPSLPTAVLNDVEF